MINAREEKRRIVMEFSAQIYYHEVVNLTVFKKGYKQLSRMMI